MPRKLPEGWPTDHASLSHEELDDLRIPQAAGKRELSLEQRREIYRRHYLPSTEEAASARRRRISVVIAVLLVGIAVAALFAFTLREQKDSEEYAVGVCDSAVRGEVQDSAISFVGERDVTKRDGVVETIKGTANRPDNGTPDFGFTCTLSLTDGEYVVDKVEITK